ncbi:hypothetical protein CBR_g2696 [Chara braunii]|uniref:Uncharacterized protein n=1 Tax=Chara braunii TaxID=69332 RepID=A0A388KDL8_CHABU|nr:hypothetical protein CBR_g2696 [Chara braunii]|eukprot:GBG68145.1 hypothetical protein CBR_g2696 [Chara braunii]
MVRRGGLYGYRARCLQFLWKWERISGEGPTVTVVLDYSYSKRETRLKINVEGGREEEIRADQGLQMATTEAKDRAERMCRRDGVTNEMRVTVAYLDEGISRGTVDQEEGHLDRDIEAESEESDLEATTLSWHGLDQRRRDHPPAEPVERGPEANSQRQRDRHR